MTIFKIPPPLDQYLRLPAQYETWHVLLLVLAALFLLNLLLQLVAVMFGVGKTNPLPAKSKDFSTRMPKASKVKAQLRESGLAIERTYDKSTPKSIALVSDEEVTTTAALNPPATATLTKAPKLDTLDDVLNELERLDARIGRDKAGSVVMVFLNGKDLPPGLLAGMKFFPKLESLHLRRTSTSDSDVPSLGVLKNLRFLYVSETKLTPKGIEALKKGNSELKVEV